MVTTIIVPHNVLVTAVARVVSTTCDEVEWYKTDGVEDEDVVAAYAAKGASNYANSLHNLVEDVYDLVDTGHAPTWDAVNGWKFDGLSQYLDTGILNTTDMDNWTIILQFSNFNVPLNSYRALCGLISYGGNLVLGATNNEVGDDIDWYNYGASGHAKNRGSYTSQGVRAIAGHKGYLNGTLDIDDAASNWSYSTSQYFLIGCMDFEGDSPSAFAEVYIQKLAIYNKILDPTQIVAITDNMEAL